MTVYNGEKHVETALRSILGQTLPNFECIVVDDGSTDATPEILTLLREDARLRTIMLPRVGRAKALNVAWRSSTGRFVANLDADDLALPERLEKQAAYLMRNPEIALLGTGSIILNEHTHSKRKTFPPIDDKELRAELVKRNPFGHSSVMLRREVLARVGGYDENLQIAIDYDLWVRMAQACTVANLPEALTVKRVHRHAYFQSRFTSWVKFKTNLAIRWRAWSSFSRSPFDLRFVLIEPTARWAYANLLRLKRNDRGRVVL